MIQRQTKAVLRNVMFAAVLTLAQSDVPSRLFLFTHAMSSSHLGFVFKIASKAGSEEVYDVRWPIAASVRDYKAPEHFKSVIFDRALMFKERLPSMLEEGAWTDTGREKSLEFLQGSLWMFRLIVLPCDFKDSIPVAESNRTFRNLAIVETFGFLCAVPRARALHADYVFACALVEHSTASSITGAPLPSSYVVSVMVAKPSNEMGFVDRLLNVLAHSFWDFYQSQLFLARFLLSGELSGEYARYLDDAESTMLIENSHRFAEWSIPVTRARIRVGSYQNEVPSTEKIFTELSDFLESGFEGFVVFSMSTFVSHGRMPDDIAAVFSEAFSRFPTFGFIWRIDELPLQFHRENICTAKWIPQKRLLADPRVILLINNCGQNSFIEAVREAVPILGIPQMGDQFVTAKRIEAFGLGSVLYTSELNADRIHQSLEELLVNKTKGRRSALLREMLRTEEEFGMADDARWWLNYKLRHSADAFRSWVIPSGHRLRLLVRHGIDVLALLLIIITCTAIK